MTTNLKFELNELTPEEIAKHYKAALDSVSLITSFVASCPEQMSEEERTNTISRNVEHLELMIGKDYWTSEDLSPIKNAIAVGKEFVS